MALALRPRDVRDLAAEYDEAPEYDHSLKTLWEEYAIHMLQRQAELADYFDLTLVNKADPYANGRELLSDLVDDHYMIPAPTACPDHPEWDGVRYAASRTVHDIDGHGAAGSHFDLEGEIYTVRKQIKHLPEHLWCVTFSDTMMQLCSTLTNHVFAPQKVVVTSHERLFERCVGG